MKVFRNIGIPAGMLLLFFLLSCSSEDGSKKSLTGKYAAEGETATDHYRDTLEVRLLANGNFELQTIAHWAAAKEDDSTRTDTNKKAGAWNNYGPDRTEVASMSGTTTLKITDPLTGEVKRIYIKAGGRELERTYRAGLRKIYHKI